MIFLLADNQPFCAQEDPNGGPDHPVIGLPIIYHQQVDNPKLRKEMSQLSLRGSCCG